MRNRGFTLIETLVTLALVSILVAGTAEMISLALLTKRKAEAHIEATRLFEDKMEHLRALRFDHPDLDPGEFRESLEPRPGGGIFVRAWTIEDLPGRMKRVGIMVSGPGGAAAEAVLLLSGRLGFRP